MVSPEFFGGGGLNRHSSAVSPGLPNQVQRQRNSLLPPESSQGDSINQRVSNPSEASGHLLPPTHIQLFHNTSNMESEKDKKSANFEIQTPKIGGMNNSGSKNDNDPSTGGFSKSKMKIEPSYGLTLGMNATREKQKLTDLFHMQLMSPNQKVQHLKILPKDVKPSLVQPDLPDFQPFEENLEHDAVDAEAVPVTSNRERRRLKRIQEETIDRDNSLNNSRIQTEGEIGPSPKKNQQANLFATSSKARAAQGGFEEQFENLRVTAIGEESKRNEIHSKVLENNIRAQQTENTVMARRVLNMKFKSPTTTTQTRKIIIAKQPANEAEAKLNTERKPATKVKHIKAFTQHSDLVAKQFFTAQKGMVEKPLETGATPTASKGGKRASLKKLAAFKYSTKAADGKGSLIAGTNKILKIKPKNMAPNASMNNSGTPSDNERSSRKTLTAFTQNANIHEAKKKVQLRQNKMIKLHKGQTASNDDLLKETPTHFQRMFSGNTDEMKEGIETKNLTVSQRNIFSSDGKPSKIGKFSDLFKLLGLPFNQTEMTFEFQNQVYRLDTQELLKDFNIYKIKTQRSSNSQISHNALNMTENLPLSQDLQSHNISMYTQQLPLSRVKTQTPDNTLFQNLSQLAVQNPNITVDNFGSRQLVNSSTTYTKKDHNPNSLSQNKLLPPTSNGMQNLNVMKRLEFSNHFQQESMVHSTRNMRSNRSAISGLSGMNMKSPNSNSMNREKSPIVSSHEQQAMRLRSKSKRKQTYSNQQSAGNLGGLQIER